VVANVQVPVGIAANICGVSANVLAQQRRSDQDVTCTAQGEGDATSNTVIRSLPRPFQP
jgi:hypothetical protein